MDGTNTSQSTDTQRSVDDEELDHENTMSILIATDNHLGFMAKDPERGRDSLVTFEEILQIAQEKEVDFILLGGDLFHDNKPSRKVLHKTMEMLRKYCLGDRPCYLEFLSDQSINFAANSFPSVNYEDPNYNVSIPVFSIHGNHDDPAGDGNLCTLNLFSVSGLVNYFGKANDVDDITISPILMQKGTTKLALYGLGAVRDERLHRTFLTKNVKMLRPKEDADSWFNIFVLHQNRARHGPKNHIPESFLDDFLDLIIWGHEHECLIEPQYSTDSGKDIFISQPGSSVATSLCEGETKKKHVGILRVAGKNFRMDKFPLKTVRAFHMRQVILSETDLDPADEDAVQEYLAEQVEELIALAGQEHTGDKRQPKRPLIRLKVEYTGGFSPFNVYTFGQQFLQRVANTKDILCFFRRRVPTGGRRGNNGDEDDIFPEFENVTMEDLISAFLKSSPKPLRMLSEHKLGLALKEFVEKDENDAIAEMVNLQIDDTRKAISTKNFPDEEIVNEVVKETERSRTEEPTKEEVARTKKVLEEALSQSKGRSEQVTLSDESEEESENQTSTRGRGRGRGRKQRGRGSRTTSKSRDNSSVTSRASTRGKKQQLSFENDYGNTFSVNKESRGTSRPDDNLNDEDEEEDPFAFPSKRQRK